MARIPAPVLDAARPTSRHPRRQLIPIVLATAATVPAIATRLTGSAPPELLAALIFGLGVVGAAFLLAWGAEALQLDISQGLALAVLALVDLAGAGSDALLGQFADGGLELGELVRELEIHNR